MNIGIERESAGAADGGGCVPPNLRRDRRQGMTHDDTSSWCVMEIVMVEGPAWTGVKAGHDDMTMSAGKISRCATRLGGVGSAVRNKIRNGMELCLG